LLGREVTAESSLPDHALLLVFLIQDT